MEKTISHPKLSIIEDNQQLIIQKKWSRVQGAVILGFSIVWTAIAGFISSGFFGSMFDFGDAPSFLVIIPMVFGLIPLLFILIGVGLFYGGLCMLNNQTKITVDQHLFQVKSGPLPLMRKQRIPISSIQQIYVHEQSSSNSSSDGVSYQLSFINQNGETQLLLGKLGFLPVSLPAFDLDEAKQLEAILENFMGIENQAVAMEVGAPKNSIQPKKTLDEEIEASNKEFWSNKESFETEEANLKPLPKEQKGSTPPSSLIAHPESLVVEESPDGLFILKKWRNPIVFFFLIFAIIWNSVVWGISSFLLPAVLSGDSWELIFPLLFLIPFIGVGLWIAYMSIAVIFNSTHIFISQDSFRLSHRPIPVGKRLTLNPKDIIEIDLRSERRSGKNGTYTVYLLEAVDQQGIRHNMNIRNQFTSWGKEEAEYIQSRIKRYLQLD
jgi:hypothetical protein